MGLSQPWVDLFPVEVLLVDDCLDALWQDAVFEGQLLDLGALDVGSVQLFLCGRGHTAELHDFSLIGVLENCLLSLPIFMDLPVNHSFLLIQELVHKYVVTNHRVFNRCLHQMVINFLLSLLYFILVWCVHVLIHLPDVPPKHLITDIIVALIVDLLDLVLVLLKLLVVAILVAGSLHRTLHTASESQSVDHSLGKVFAIRLIKLFFHAFLEVLDIVIIVLLHHIFSR